MPHAGGHLETQLQADVVVIGGGLAGLAAAIHLTRGGLKVVCLEPREEFSKVVGESLDWSAPQLFAQLGLPMDALVESGAATFKRHITIATLDGTQEEFSPGAWLADPPWNVEVRTLHLDRLQVHALLLEIVRRQGTVTLHERATGFTIENGRIVSVETSGGRILRPRWVVDASGANASVLGRRFNLPSTSYGPRKIALWTHLPTEQWVEGTTLYTLSPDDEYMEWIWEIPIRPGVSSIGYIAPGSRAKSERAAGLTNVELLTRQMQKFPRLREMVQRFPVEEVASTSFLCRTYKDVCGPNWIIVGEAASQSDPITGNGVTAALRHAEEGSALICRYQHRDSLPRLTRFVYNLRVRGMGRYFNSLIEKLYYEPPVRAHMSIFAVANIYTTPAWLTNLLYARTRPRRLLGTLLLCSAMLTLRATAWGVFQLCSLLGRSSRKPDRLPSPQPATGDTANHLEKEEPRVLHTPR
jgi:flavin-dependent dehydrogenase